MDIGFQWGASLAPNKRVSLFFEVLKGGTDFSSLPMKVLDGIFFQLRLYAYIENLFFSVASFMNNLKLYLDNLC